MATVIEALLKADVRNFQAGMDQAEASVERLDRQAEGLGSRMVSLKRLMTAAAVVGVGVFAKAAVQAAVDAQEAGSAFATSFGPAAQQAGEFVEEFANKAGFATYELEQLMAVTGSVVQGIGATEEESAALSERMVRLAADVASFSNAEGGAQAVMLALQSAINGEREALKTYGLALSEAEVQQKAFEMTGKASVDELTRMDKALATVELAYGKASKAVGDLDRTQDSTANTLRRVQAQWKELTAQIGETLIPVLDRLLGALSAVLGAFAGAENPARVLSQVWGTVLTGTAEEAAAAARSLQENISFVGMTMGTEVAGQTLRLAGNVDEARAAYETLTAALDETFEPFRDLFAAQEDVADSTRALTPEQEQLTEQFYRQRRAIEDVAGAESRLSDMRRAAVDPAFAAMRATEDLTAAYEAYHEAVEASDLAGQRQALMDVAEAQMDLNDAMAELDAGDSVAALTGLMRQAGMSQEAIDLLAEAIRNLNATPVNYHVSVPELQPGFVFNPPGLQHGGSVPPGGAAIVGEAGPELITGGISGATVTPLAVSPAPSSVHVTVNVAGSIRSDQELAEVIESQLVRAIRRGGTSELLS